MAVVTSFVMAQRGRRSVHRGVPTWQIDANFPGDTFTFARIRYRSFGYWGRDWATDYPDSDLNFSLRLHQLTSLIVNPDPVVLSLTDKQLFDYPFIYIVEPGNLTFQEAEVVALRRYLNNGGFLMIDDFWGEQEWRKCAMEMSRVFPKREFEEVPLSHEIFNCVYRLQEKPQIPSIDFAWRGRHHGITWEPRRSDTSVPHYRAIKDDDGRIMVFACHNTDLGDGWEREGENEWYFEEFSVKKAYPLGINIVTYALTH